MSIILPGSSGGSSGGSGGGAVGGNSGGPTPGTGSPQNQPAAPKIVVDSDWKSQAQAEKEKLNAQAEAKAAAAASSAPKGRAAPGEPAQLTDLVSMLVTQALMYMGGIPDPRTGQAVVALDYAKIYIDMLGVLEEKTKGNLTSDEEKMLGQTAHELRMEFVEVGAAIAQAVKEGKIKPQQLGGSAAAIGLSGGVSAGTATGTAGPGASGLGTAGKITGPGLV